MSMDQQGTSVEELCREIGGVEKSTTDGETSGSKSAEIVASATAELAHEGSFAFDDELVKQSLDELLLVLVAIGDDGTHGKKLMGDLKDVFGVRLSPGTVYPRLHDLEEEGLLKVHELVRTKEYRLADSEAARNRVEQALRQHFALGAVFESSLEEL